MKNQFKKSLSLIMAVLMLMSCWVWVAPSEAEAAGGKTQYYVKYTARITNNWDNGSGNSKIRIYYKPQNGKGTETYKEIAQAEKFWGQAEGNVYTVWEGLIDGFPTKLTQYAKTSTGRNMNCDQCTLYVGTSADNCTNVCFSGGDFGVGSCSENNFPTVGSTASSLYPYIASLDNPSAIELTLGALGSTTNATATGNVASGKDQYGISWEATFPTSGWTHKMALDGNGTTTGLSTNNISVSGTSNKPTITAKPDTQKLKANPSGGKVTYYLLSTYGSATATTQVIVSYPAYQATFYANGGQIGIDKDNVSATGEIKVPESKDGAKTYYGAPIGKQPAHAYREGFDFKGFYTVQNADATGKDASFSGTKFVDNETTVDTSGDSKWYAAWHAKPIYATFVTQDGQLIGTLEGRYNNYFTAPNMYNGDEGLNSAVKAAFKGSDTAKEKLFGTGNTPIYKDGSTTYTFAGWKIIEAYDESVIDGNEDKVLKGDVTFQATYTKADATTYTVTFENGKGGVISSQGGYTYRTEITSVPGDAPVKTTDERYSYEFIGWAKKLGSVNYFAVDANGKDKDGATVVYVSKDTPSFIVKGNDTYVPVFRMIDREYNVTFNYKIDGGLDASVTVGGYKYGDTVKMPEIKDNYTAGGYRYFITAWNFVDSFEDKQLEDITVEKDLVLKASYGNTEAAKYVINFYGKDKDGKTDIWLNEYNNIYEHDSDVTAPEVPITIDTPESLYTFDKWSPLVTSPANGDADYYATYTKKDYADVYFYNYDDTLLYKLDGKENTKFVGDVIPAYSNIVDGVEVLPTKAEDEVGTYNFIGWKDGNGDPVVPGTDKFTGDIHLTAQFETVYKDYTVKFINGEDVYEKTYHYGEAIVKPANPTKDPDDEFTYEFKYWSPDVSDICYGDATYEAVYGRDYNYYTVTWLKDNKTVLSTSNYKYGQKIQQQVFNTPVAYPDAETGKTWAFKHWVQCDANGNDILVDGKQVIFKRGQAMPAEALYFYPVFEEASNVLTVTFFKEDGTTEIGKAKVNYGEELKAYGDAFLKDIYKDANETHHFSFDKWINVSGGAAVTEVIADVSVKPSYTANEHTKDVYDIIINPTCTEPGLADVSCSDDACDKIFKNVGLDVIADDAAPAGQVSLGMNNNVWTSDTVIDFDNDPITYVGPSTNIIVNAWDIGSRSKNNPDAILNRGVGKIEYYVSKSVVADPSTIGNWTTVYDYKAVADDVLQNVLSENGKTMQDYNAMSDAAKKAIDDQVKAILATYKANATGILSNLDLKNGKEYIIYIRVSDREVNGESNKCYFSTGKFSYGSEPAEITVRGDGFGTKFCQEATISVTDDNDGFKVYIDGTEVALNAEGKLVYNVKGSHTVTVVDSNGNKTAKNFEIKGNHAYKTYTIAATCENDGSTYDICTVCGSKTAEEIRPATGHTYSSNYIDTDADCINDGYRTFACDNNCGTKLVVKPANAEGKLAEALKWDVTAGDDGKGAWVELTAEDLKVIVATGDAADLKALKATGVHTYAKVKDEEGNDTNEDAWVIDKAATCSVEGSKHRDCTICGIIGRETAVIALDKVNGHKFYREKVTTEPTCTTEGYKTKTCRYCGETVTTATLPALGHTAGNKYVTLVEPTCTTPGSEMRVCDVCDCHIGEGEYDPEKGPVAKEIAPLGHAWIKTGDVVKEVTTNEQGESVTVYKQYYECKNNCGETKFEILEDYVEPKEVTITFMNDDVAHFTVTKSVGESIIATDVSKPSKTADTTYEYIFSHWADSEGNAVKFPIDVKDDAVYYAVYNNKFINYTITYYIEKDVIIDGVVTKELEEYKKTGYLHNGEEVTLADAPKKAKTWEFEYEFAGWQISGGDTVYTDKATISGANIELVATYNGVKRQYAVSYKVGNVILETFAVKAGLEARACPIIPSKDSDSKYHYEFKGWDKATQLQAVTSNIVTTPNFEAALHSFKPEDGGSIEVKTAATCTTKAVYTYTCACGYTYDNEVPNSELGHTWGDPVYDENTGKNVITCDRCHTSETDTRTFTAKFFANADDASAIKNVSYIPWGTTIAGRLPDAPTKESTSVYDFTFKGWAIKGDTTETIVDVESLVITQDYDFVAVFTSTVRKYNVVFRIDAYNVVKTFYDVPAGSSVTLDLAADPERPADDNGHYIFKGWKGYTEGVRNVTVVNVQEDVYVVAAFEKEDHDFTFRSEDFGTATCQNGKGTRNYCECGKYEDKTGNPLDHDFVVVERVEATENKDGYILYQCANEIDGVRCDKTKTEVLKHQSTKIVLSVQVLCNGVAKDNIKVEFYEKTASAVATPATTGKDGYAKVMAEKSEAGYDCYVNIDGNYVQVTNFSADASGNYSGTYSYTEAEAECGCACHRTNFWGTIFRFFHKIIKLFTGEFKCCGNPDPMYG